MVELTGDSAYFMSTFRLVVEHVHGIVMAKGPRHLYAKTALEILLTLFKKTSFPFVGVAWINDLLRRAAWGEMDDEMFTILLRFSALRKESGAVISPLTPSGRDFNRVQRDEADPQSPGGTTTPENPTLDHTLLDMVLQNVKTCSEQKDGWQDDAVCGGLMAIRDIPGLRFCSPGPELLEMLSGALEKREIEGEDRGENQKGDKSFRVRKTAYDIVLDARDGWFKSADLRQTLENLDLPRKLHSVVFGAGGSGRRRSFLEMMEILSKDRDWHPYLRKAMDIWLPLHHEGPRHALHILTNVGELLPGRGDHNINKPLEKVLTDEWAAVPGRLLEDLTADRLGPLAEVTEQFRNLFLFSEEDRGAVLGAVEQVIPSLEKRRDGNYSGPGDDIRHVIDNLLTVLREPMQPNSC
jgi:hypothetical protein